MALNHRDAIEALGEAATIAPYKAPPQAPVLYIKPPNTRLASGGVVAVPTDVEALCVQPTLALLIGRTATRVSAAGAWDHVEAMALAAEVSVPHASLFRPAIRQRCRDGFLPLGAPRAVVRERVEVALRIGDAVRARLSTTDLLRPIPQLLADVTDFMSLTPGDVLLVGLPLEQPLARPGDAVTVEAQGFSTLRFSLAAELEPDEGAAA